MEDESFQKTLSAFKENGTNVSFVVADEIMGHISPHYTIYTDKIKQTEAYATTVASEARGLKDLLDGKYRVVLTPEKPRD